MTFKGTEIALRNPGLVLKELLRQNPNPSPLAFSNMQASTKHACIHKPIICCPKQSYTLIRPPLCPTRIKFLKSIQPQVLCNSNGKQTTTSSNPGEKYTGLKLPRTKVQPESPRPPMCWYNQPHPGHLPAGDGIILLLQGELSLLQLNHEPGKVLWSPEGVKKVHSVPAFPGNRSNCVHRTKHPKSQHPRAIQRSA